jgi:organic hydroperoxide reductase OsmC/OhrA
VTHEGTEGSLLLDGRLCFVVYVLDQEVEARLVDAAQEVCPYSNATRGNIDVAIVLG